MDMKFLENLSPGMKRMLTWAGAAAVIGLLALTLGGQNPRERHRDRETVKNVFSDINTREVGVDSLAASVDLMRQREDLLRGELREMRREMDLIRKNAGLLGGGGQDPEKITARLKEIDDMLNEFRVIKSLLPKRLRELRKEDAAREGEEALAGDSSVSGRGEDNSPDSRDSLVPEGACFGENCPGDPDMLSRDSAQGGSPSHDIREEFVFEEIPLEPPKPSPQYKPPVKRQIRRIGGSGSPGSASSGASYGNASGNSGSAKAAAKKVPGDPSGRSSGKRQVYLPAGTIMSGYLLTGLDAPTRDEARGDPFPVLINLDKSAILPGDGRYDLSGCFVLAAGYGDLSSERVYLRAEKLSCMGSSGRVAEQKFSAYISGEDGKAGVRGRLVSKQGRLIARSLTAGFLEGLAGAFDVNPVPVISTVGTHTTQYQSVYSRDALRSAAVSGAGKALDRVADFYLRLADSMFPVLEIDASRRIDIIVTEGVALEFDFRGREGAGSGFYRNSGEGL